MEGVLLALRSEPGERPTALVVGRNTAFTALVAAHHADLLRVCYVILGDAALAEDAAQSAWMKAWRKFDQLREPEKTRSWLLVVAANEARQMARRRRPGPLLMTTAEYGSDIDPRQADLAAALRGLSADERRLLSLRYVAELTSEQIGLALGISAGAVRHRLMRVLARLRVDLERE